MSRSRYDQLGPAVYAREQLRNQQAVVEQVSREVSPEQQALREEQQERARSAEQITALLDAAGEIDQRVGSARVTAERCSRR